MKSALAFDDVLLVPQHNTIASRKDLTIDTSVKLSNYLTLKIPVISSCMDTVTGVDMAIAMWKAGGLGILHRYNTPREQFAMLQSVHQADAKCAVAVGISGDYQERVRYLAEFGATIFCVDVAHGDCDMMENALKWMRDTLGDEHYTIIAGNVATGDGAYRLALAGADAIRVGIGGGSMCTTRLVTGCGMPTFQSIIDCNEYLAHRTGLKKEVCLIADGGIRTSGDIVKSIAAGAGAVILGQLLAGTDEAPGYVVTGPDLKTPIAKSYRGMASFDAQVEWNPAKRNEIVPEGDKCTVPYKGPVSQVLYNLIGGLRSGMTYNDAHTFAELRLNAEFRQITGAGLHESKPHAKY